jgi:hypothetical protein
MPKPHPISGHALATLVTFVASVALLATGCAEHALDDTPAIGVARSRLDASERTTCWLTERGAVSCNGALLRGTSNAKDGAFVKVSVGGDVACGLRENGTARCFIGWIGCEPDRPCSVGSSVLLGPGGDLRRDLPDRYLDLDVEPGGSSVLALDSERQVLRFFIDGGTGELSPADVALAAGGLLTYGPDGGVNPGSAQTDFVRVAGSAFQLCGLDATGHVTCWELANPSHHYEPEGTFVALASGSSHLCALATKERKSIVCWGGNEGRQAADARGPFTAVSAGDDGTCALLEGGEARCWGDGSPDPGPVPDGTFVAVASGGGHRCAMRESGAVECWGFGAGLPAVDSSADVEGPIGGAADSGCVHYAMATIDRFQCELARGYLSTLGLVKVNAVEFVQMFGSTKQRNIWVSGGSTNLPDGGSIDAAAVYRAIDPDDSSARLLAPIPVGTHLVHENPGGDRYELMTKLADGASPENGDWEFTRHLLDGTRVSLQAGSGSGYGGPAPPTCLDCHEMAERRDRTNLLWGIPRSALP